MAINFCFLARANEKNAPGKAKLCNFQKLALNPFKNGKRLKLFPSFLGEIGL